MTRVSEQQYVLGQQALENEPLELTKLMKERMQKLELYWAELEEHEPNIETYIPMFIMKAVTAYKKYGNLRYFCYMNE